MILNQMKRIFAKVIVNPVAGDNVTYRRWPRIQNLLTSLGLTYDYQFTEGRGHAIELARIAAGSGCPYLVAVGGDGTVNEVANGILQSENAAKTDLGIVNTGTGSDLARTTGISHDYSLSCSSLTSTKRLNIDVGLVNYTEKGIPKQRYFVNSAGIGFDATVVEAVEKLPKYFGGTIPYLVGLLRSFAGYRNKPVTIGINGRQEQARVLSIVAANGRYFGGGMQVAPGASLTDGLLDIVIVGDFGKLELLRTFPRVYKGTHLSHPKIRLEKETGISIESPEKFLVHADGELLGEGPATFSLLPGCLNLVA